MEDSNSVLIGGYYLKSVIRTTSLICVMLRINELLFDSAVTRIDVNYAPHRTADSERLLETFQRYVPSNHVQDHSDYTTLIVQLES